MVEQAGPVNRVIVRDPLPRNKAGEVMVSVPSVAAPLRMEETARFAAENGFDSFLTTLLISPYQNHELLIRTGREAAKKYQVEFLYRDFRPVFRQGQEKARELGLYLQKYCGCVFSEEDRYRKRPKKPKPPCGE